MIFTLIYLEITCPSVCTSCYGYYYFILQYDFFASLKTCYNLHDNNKITRKDNIITDTRMRQGANFRGDLTLKR